MGPLTVVEFAGVLVATLLVGWLAIRRTRAEPRRWSNAHWLLVAALLALQLLGSLGLLGAGVSTTVVIAVLLAPLLVVALMVFLLLNGVIMLRREGRSLGNLLSLLAGLAMLGLLISCVPVLLSGVGPLLAAWAALALASAYLGFQFVSYVGYALLYPALVRNRPASWVVVLGSGLREDGTVPPLLASRIGAGLTAYQAKRAHVLVMSGGKGDDERRSEAEAMAEWALDHGADPATLLLETRSTTTEENLRFTSELLHQRALTARPGPTGEQRSSAPAPVGPVPSSLGPGLVATSNYHVLRAAILARNLGIDAQVTGSRTAGYYWPSAMLREFVAVLREHPVVHLVLGGLLTVPVPVLILLAL